MWSWQRSNLTRHCQSSLSVLARVQKTPTIKNSKGWIGDVNSVANGRIDRAPKFVRRAIALPVLDCINAPWFLESFCWVLGEKSSMVRVQELWWCPEYKVRRPQLNLRSENCQHWRIFLHGVAKVPIYACLAEIWWPKAYLHHSLPYTLRLSLNCAYITPLICGHSYSCPKPISLLFPKCQHDWSLTCQNLRLRRSTY